MGARVREWKGAWWIYIDHQGRRKLKRVGKGPVAKTSAGEAAKVFAALVLRTAC